MKKFSSILIVSLLFSVGTVFAQSYTFKVLANKGQNQVKRAGTSTAEALKTGAMLNAGDELIVSNGAYIGLMHKTGKTIEVRTPGTQKINDLEAKVASQTSSVASKYAAFIASKMDDDGANSYARRMNATGAVSRATGSAAINVKLPASDRTLEVLGDNAIITWDAPEGADENTQYTVTILNIFDDVIFEDDIAGTQIELNFDEMTNEMGLYIFSVKQKGNDEIKSESFGIKKVAPGDMSEVEDNYKGLQAEVSDESAMSKLIYASFFEENGLLLDAITKYEEAIKISPEIEDFQVIYDMFLQANGIVEPVEE
jgi:hypothetical protein